MKSQYKANIIFRLKNICITSFCFLLLASVVSNVYGQFTEDFQPDMKLLQKYAVMTYPDVVIELEKLATEERIEYSLILASLHINQYKNSMTARHFCEYAHSVAEKHNISKGKIFLTEGYIHDMLSKEEQAIKAYEKASSCFRKDKNIELLKGSLLLLGGVCYNYGEFIKSIDVYEELLKLCTDADDIMKAQTLFDVGEVYYRLSNISKAVYSVKQAKDIYKNLDNQKGLADCQKLLGNIYLAKKDYIKAKGCYLQASKAYESMDNAHGQGNCNFNLGIMSNKIKQYSEAEKYLIKSAYLFTKAASIQGVGIAQMELGRAYYFQGDYAKAELALMQAEYFLTGNSKYRLAQTKEYLGDLKKAQKDNKESLVYYEASAELFEDIKLKADLALVQKKIKELTSNL
jgi:tetratricopeptide (TPR) repeat protein